MHYCCFVGVVGGLAVLSAWLMLLLLLLAVLALLMLLLHVAVAVGVDNTHKQANHFSRNSAVDDSIGGS